MNKFVVYEFKLYGDLCREYPDIYSEAASIVQRHSYGDGYLSARIDYNNYHIEIERLGETVSNGKTTVTYNVKVMGFLLEETERYVESGISLNGEMLYRMIKRETI